jgi:signal transduction histidine kinase
MKKVALVFVLAVFVPSLVLAWLAVRSLRDQQFLLERQQSLLYQGVADALATKVQDALADQQHTFALKVTTLLRDGDARAVARSFDSRLCKDWPLAKVGFAVTTAGEILAPSPQGRTEARTFYTDNGRFLANRETVEVYLNPKTAFNTVQVPSPTPQPTSFPSADPNLGTNRALQSTIKPSIANTPSQQSTPLSLDRNAESGLPQPQSQRDLALGSNTQEKDLLSVQNQATLIENNTYLNRKPGYNQKQEMRNVIPQRQAELFQNNAFPRYKQQQASKPAPPPATNAPVPPPTQARSEASVRGDQQVQIIQPPAPAPHPAPAGPVPSLAVPEDNQQQFSKSTPSEAEFRQLIGDDHEGTLARFVDNKLNVLFWYRPPLNTDFVFGAQIALPRLAGELQTVVQEIEATLREEICIALLDDTAKPVALSHPGFHALWKRPFVATEIGESLPHWEVAVYLLNPAKLTQSARTLTLTLGLLIGVLLLAIGVGSWLIVADLNRQLTLARQKTDFVSNVSHELKTPLTSIRMFSELLAEGRVSDRAKQRTYLGIITAETARLTRLINNVLDFARIERGEKKYNFQQCDLVDVVRETADTYRPHLEANGFQFACELPDSPVFINGDRDALAQVVVNLLSNAEKYSDSRKEITLRAELQAHPPPCPAWSGIKILDRGLGVPKGSEEKIFEQFYRAHDSLSNGIQGSGLGLTLARQIARAHGGDVVYESRDGGGSCFTLLLPVPGSAK